MAQSVKALSRSGMISGSALAKLRGTKPQNSKMAEFESRDRDEGKGTRGHGNFGRNHINDKSVQTANRMSKGGGEPDGRQPKRMQIDGYPATQGKKFPAGGNVASKGSKKVGIRGGVTQTGPEYGGGGRNTQ